MALLNSYTNDNTGEVNASAYFKARKEIELNKNIITFSCDIYFSQEARNDSKSPIASVEYKIETTEDISTDEQIRAGQLYLLLKTLPEFKFSVDI